MKTKIRLFWAKILCRFFAIETLALALKVNKDVMRVDITTGRELDEMANHFKTVTRKSEDLWREVINGFRNLEKQERKAPRDDLH